MNSFLKRTFELFALLSTTYLLTGCVVSIGTGNEMRSDPPTIVVTDSADAATIAEIDAAKRLSMESDRTHALRQIAERPSLTVPVQVHLINVTYRSLRLDSNRTQVLGKIIARADFCYATRYTIVSQLQKLSSDSVRQSVLSQLNDRLKANPSD